MKRYLAVLLLVTGCASEPKPVHMPDWQDFKGVETRREFIVRWGQGDPNWQGISEPMRECLIDGIERNTPPRFFEAVDAFLADKTDVRWEDLSAVDRSIDWEPINDRNMEMVADCKVKHGG